MSPELPGRVFDCLDVELHNLYGPTEAAVNATWWPCQRGDTRMVVPIGRPIANVRAYVLNSFGQPVPVGVPGELHLAGTGLARGYLNDPQLTAERFVSGPFRDVSEGRLYRTGDCCRWLADGSLEFLGRFDRQVKVRGCRIEMDAVEAVLTRHPAVREAAVTAHVEPEGHRLIAYVVAEGNGPTRNSNGATPILVLLLRGTISENGCGIWCRLRSCRCRRCRAAGQARSRGAGGRARSAGTAPRCVEPRTPLEETGRPVARRGGSGTGEVEDDFFDLGGSSIQAAVLINRVREARRPRLRWPCSTPHGCGPGRHERRLSRHRPPVVRDASDPR
jgi:hypothetical protein